MAAGKCLGMPDLTILLSDCLFKKSEFSQDVGVDNGEASIHMRDGKATPTFVNRRLS